MAPAEVDAVVVGAGFSGLYMVHKLRGLGLSVRGFEAGADVGGTWYWNRYPGARCDVESMYYAYSFDRELVQEWEWSEKYSAQPEILRYLQHVADRHDLRRDFTFNTQVTAAAYDEASSRWTVTTSDGDQVSARYCILAVGCLSSAKLPEIPGLEQFRGRTFHTAHWPHEGVDFTGQRVGVIGTGSSGIQVIPLVAEQAEQLTVFQRTANFAFAAFNGPADQDKVSTIKSDYPSVVANIRSSYGGIPPTNPPTSALEVTPEERQRRYDERWRLGLLSGPLQAFYDIMVDRAANETAAEYVRERIREAVTDPEVAEALCPQGYAIGTKRPCLGTRYYETYNRDNVTLVNLRQTPLVAITERGIATTEGEHELDSLVFATGFDAMTGPLLAIDITGRDGATLREEWASGPITYLGLATAGFPNMFHLTGPGSPSVITNMAVSIEQHVEWVADAVAYLRDHGVAAIEADPQAQQEWTQHVQEVASYTLYPETDSWYTGSNVPGKPRVFMPYLGGVGLYRDKCQQVADDGYPGFVLTA
ncbi:NAD(P)/FAD-dependent oxidoreductase [Rhodococcus sp. X156]|uniref:flavin-containing monooxygenase n=1 Tax=Rhodococcus sp. X156 TaxID=2499145 RepID=UPI000FDB881E|nr:NAD(P)/FAD-dependent oxidoreductase [Rhodococcus sp. X156]